jgi:hypothetical protein
VSEIYKDRERHHVYAGLTVDVAEDSLDKVTALLAGVESNVGKAVGSALKRAAAAGKTVAKKAVADEYTLSQSEFLSQTKNINHINRESSGEVSVAFGFAGYVIPLLKFDTCVGSDGRVQTHVKRSSAREVLDHAWVASMGGHRGVYERIGKQRHPDRELYGPATPQMMYSNEAVLDTMEEKMADTYEKRIDHEILRILNGWGS